LNCTLDASAMTAFVSGEPGGVLVDEVLADRRNQGFAYFNAEEKNICSWRSSLRG
jgi:hypothetical protein